MRVAFLAPEGTFTWETSQIVARARGWADDAEFVAYPTGEAVVDAVDRGEAGYGVAAVATSLAGERGLIRETVKKAKHVKIVDEYQRVCHYALMARTGQELANVRSVHTVQKAIDDCAGWLREHLPGAELTPTPSTGAGAAYVAASHDESAAIAPPAAASRHGLQTLAENIEDDPNNWTRWLILQHG
jgi:chorismate mutase/prephenate dehydratase